MHPKYRLNHFFIHLFLSMNLTEFNSRKLVRFALIFFKVYKVVFLLINYGLQHNVEEQNETV